RALRVREAYLTRGLDGEVVLSCSSAQIAHARWKFGATDTQIVNSEHILRFDACLTLCLVKDRIDQVEFSVKRRAAFRNFASSSDTPPESIDRSGLGSILSGSRFDPLTYEQAQCTALV